MMSPRRRLLDSLVCCSSLLGLVLVLIVPLYWKKVFVITFTMAVMAISWDFLASCGLVSLGQALFFAVGAYIAGGLNHYFGLPVILTIPMAAILGGLISTILIFPALRLRGMYFSMVTLIIPLMLMRIVEATKILGGAEGLSGLSPLPGLAFSVGLSMIAMWLSLFLLRRLFASSRTSCTTSLASTRRATIRSSRNDTIRRSASRCRSRS